MSFEIINPQEDMHGNKKENIFLALDENGQYMAHSYVWAYENYHSSYARPRNILISLNIPEAIESNRECIMQILFDNTFKRAYELKDELWYGQTVRIYGGALAGEKGKIQFYLKQGFKDDDATLFMRINLKSVGLISNLPMWNIERNQLDTESSQNAFIERHKSIFINDLNLDKLHYFMAQPMWALYGIYKDQELAGECMIFEKDASGYIEMLYVLPEVRGKGASDALLNSVFLQFKEKGYKEANLIVWQRNARAIKFYEKHGFRLTGEREEVYPGIDV